jgi:cytochrome subunit of sulfide dehydrogenase
MKKPPCRPVLRSIVFTMLLTTASVHAQTNTAQPGDLQARSMAASCSACHGTNGAAAPGMVALAGYDKANMIKAMADFKSGARPATLMHQLSKGYSEAQVEAIASYFAAQKK